MTRAGTNQRAGERRTRSGSNVATPTQSTKKRKVQDPLTKDDIPTIVQAVLEALPGPSSGGPSDAVDPATNPSPSQSSSELIGATLSNQSTTREHDVGDVPTQPDVEHRDGRRAESPRHVDPSEHLTI